MNNGNGLKLITITGLLISIVSFTVQLELTAELAASVIFGMGYIIGIAMLYDKHEKLEKRVSKLEGEKK